MNPIDSVSITVLMENRTTDARLVCEHGLSFYVQTPDASVLFDTGQSGDFVSNAALLGVDLASLDALVLSHGHYDHTDGMPALSGIASPQLPVYVHPAASLPRFSIKDPARPKYVGMSEASRELLQHMEVHPVTAPAAIGSFLNCTGPVPRCTDYEDTGGPFFLDPQGETEDPIADDQSLVLRTSRGLVLLLGCAHAGIVNTLRYARELYPGLPIHAIIGGFHLLNADSQRLQRSYAELEAANPEILAPCHCTGERAMREMAECFADRFCDCRTGTRFEFPVTAAS